MSQLRLAFVNSKSVLQPTNSSRQKSTAFSRSSPALRPTHQQLDRLYVIRPNAAAVIARLVSNMLDEAEGRKL